ncbi:putative ATPase involved in cell division [secondary endosymbiont of Heteropsylla cubana]|uniref:Cell division ATP-binding protein FtsE n=1 Tax=secondary endosymbiont of Heteropsylla cubana TaxID=134287 RepID=J3YSU9_9ENTR|nr:ATP-binding cassette domain-containing protein [secondary endosymbiont of Heteropsylla cubana]AFP85388.1 putative ATPase involved in cell division [secondary endosymbiont of Heteropsylla cubana]
MIRCKQVGKTYHTGHQALQEINFHVRENEKICLTGYSGSGKTTLLELICGIQRPTTGHIFFNGYNLSSLKTNEILSLRRQIGIIFQDHHLLLERTVYDNVAIPLIVCGESLNIIRRRVPAALDRVGLLDKAKNTPIQLSRGEKQLIAIARAIINKPAVLVIDEPTNHLDDIVSNTIFCLFEEFNHIGVAILMATINTRLIANRNYRVLTLHKGKVTENLHAK